MPPQHFDGRLDQHVVALFGRRLATTTTLRSARAARRARNGRRRGRSGSTATFRRAPLEQQRSPAAREFATTACAHA
jgi:hypothetical protein